MYDVTYFRDGVNARGAWGHADTSLTIRCDSRPDYRNRNCVSGSHAYSVGVRARNPSGHSGWVNSPWAQPPVPDPVSNISVTHHGNKLTVTWDAATRATAYDVTYYGNGVNARGA